MELTNEFRVPVPVGDAWALLTDVERIAPCMPGAQLQEVAGDEYRGIVKVKVGPITAQYKGAATFVERDEAAHRAVLRAEGRDTRGQGNANATITATLVGDGGGTTVSVVTDLTVTGRVAQFGRGVMADVSAKLLGQFVQCLETNVLSGGGAVAADAPGAPNPGPPVATSSTSISRDAGANGQAGQRPAATETETRRIDAPEAEPIDLLDAAGSSVAKRALPAAGIVVFLLLVVRRRRRRRRRERIAA